MNKTDYMKLLGTALVARGIPESAAIRHVKILSLSVTDEELAAKSDDDVLLEVDKLAENVATLLKEDEAAKQSAPAEKQGQQPAQGADAASKTAQDKKTLPEYVSPDSVVPVDFDREEMPRGDDFEELVGKTKIKYVREEKPINPTKGAIAGGRARIVLLMIARVLVTILKIAAMVILVGLTVAGVALFFVGIVYAISQMNTFREAGIFEIGLTIIIGGVILALGVIVYNCVGNFIPKLQRLLRRRVKSLKKRIKDAAYKLKKMRRRAA